MQLLLLADIGCDDVVIGRILLQHHPHHAHVVLRMAPVALCIEVAKLNLIVRDGDGVCVCV